MSLHLLTFCLILASRVVHAFSGWMPFSGSVLQGRQTEMLTLTRDAANTAASRSQQRTAPQRFRAHLNEYEVFFNKACKSGRALMSQLSPEERAQRAIEVGTSDVDMRRNLESKGEGEELEDKIIEMAKVLREKADVMMADTGAIDFDAIQPMIQEISVLKMQYKLVVGAVTPPEDETGDGTASGEE